MSLEIQLNQVRPTCPFCRDEVSGGHVWICPGCQAHQHAECLDEHGACASCGVVAPPTPAPALEVELTPPESLAIGAPLSGLRPAPVEERALPPAPEWLVEIHEELRALGFVVQRHEDPGRPMAYHPAFAYGKRWVDAREHRVVVRQRRLLTVERLEAEAERWVGESPIVVYFRVDDLTPAAEAWIKTRWGRPSFFPVVHRAKGEPVYRGRTSFSGFGAVATQPGLRYLARRLLDPTSDRAQTVEGLTPTEALVFTSAFLLVGALVLVLLALVGFALRGAF